jgi:hypothetical protein
MSAADTTPFLQVKAHVVVPFVVYSAIYYIDLSCEGIIRVTESLQSLSLEKYCTSIMDVHESFCYHSYIHKQ